MAADAPRSWARTPGVRPARVERPRSVGDVVAAVRAAGRDGLPIRPLGAGSSRTVLTATDGLLLDLSGLARVRSVDVGTGTVQAETGIRLFRLWPLLWDHGLSVAGAGGSGRQSLGGALATGSHGTGRRFGGPSSPVRALEMVLADGAVVTCSEQEHPELFQAARVGLGAFGVVTAVTLDCEPARVMETRSRTLPVTAVLDGVDELIDGHDHVELAWVPHTDHVVCRTIDRLPVAQLPRGRWSAVRGTGRVTGRLPGRIPGRLAGRGAVREVDGNAVDRGYRALSRRPRPGERESEYAVPRACFGAALDELRQRVDARRTVPGVLRVRFGPAEEAWLAMGQGRETCYLTATVPRGQPFEPLFEALDAVAARYDGRPHWGREYGLRAAALRGRYPRFDDARAVRELVDPFRRFLNPHLQTVFGG